VILSRTRLTLVVSCSLVVLAFLVFLLRSGSSVRSTEGGLKPEGQRKPAPEFTLKDINGKSVTLSDYRGKVVLLNFWATWCGPCKMEIPWFTEFEQKYKSRGFAVIGISMDDDGWDSVRPFIEHTHMNYRVALGNDSVAQLYGGVDSLPTSFLIDREGRVVAVHIGLVGKSDYQDEIDQLLEKSSSTASRDSRVLTARAR